ncbi:MAG TPA: guanylate kinase [Longimicrobiales bacterium]|nr:guanylate kinase [Longimicrobiales bacterium]
MSRYRPFPLVIAAPSGAGKTSLARALVETRPDMVFSLSATTRAPRPGERDGIDYRFVDDFGFDALAESGELLEWAHVHGRRYGTLRSGVQAALAAGSTVVLDIDVQGAQLVQRALSDAVLVFVLPPSVSEMKRRLHMRGSESAEQLATRMRTARAELDAVKDFDYVVVNDEFEHALRTIEAIVAAERERVARQPHLDDMLDGLRADIDEIIQRSH